MRIIFIARLV